MLAFENVRPSSKVDIAYDAHGEPVLVEVYKNGCVRVLDNATAYAVVNEDVGLVKAHFLRKGAAVSSRVDMLLH